MYIEGERLMFMDVVQHLFTDGGPGGGHLIPERIALVNTMISDVNYGFFDDSYEGKMATSLLYVGPAIYHARRDKTVEKANEIYDQISRLAKMTPHQRHINDVNSDKLVESVSRYRYFLVSMFMPALDKASELVYRAKISHGATITVLALQRCKREQEQYPESLVQLKAEGYLREIPLDPFSDKALIYRKTTDGFILYSVGLNLMDDGGEIFRDRKSRVRSWAGEGDAIFWPVQE
jgi:hypothetical protein